MLYFLPGREIYDPKALPPGLYRATDSARDINEFRAVDSQEVGAGLLLSTGLSECKINDRPIRWIKGKDFVAGIDAIEPVPEYFLRRDKAGRRLAEVPGEPVELGDGNQWHVPWLGPCFSALPVTVGRTDESQFISNPLPHFAELCRMSEYWYDIYELSVAGDAIRFKVTDLFDYLERVIQVTYSISYLEISALALVNSDQALCGRFLAACLGANEAMRQKKSLSSVHGFMPLDGDDLNQATGQTMQS